MGLCILLGAGNLGFFFGVPLGFHIAPKQNYRDKIEYWLRAPQPGSGMAGKPCIWSVKGLMGVGAKIPPGGAPLPQNSCWKGECVEHGPSAPGTWALRSDWCLWLRGGLVWVFDESGSEE